MFEFELADHALNSDILRTRLFNGTAGALATFEGWVRDHHEGRAVRGLRYEAYPELATAEGAKIIHEARAKFDILGALGVHRHGELAIGDIAVWIGVTAAHRDTAFAACRYIIDQIKHRVPIWKFEHYIDGEAKYQEGTLSTATRPSVPLISKTGLLSPDAALDLVLERATPIPPTKTELEDAVGLVLAETVVADRDYPPFDRAMMDGYAVRVADTGHEVAVIGEVAAGRPSALTVEPGRVVRIFTGAPCPRGTEAVVPQELVVRADIDQNQRVKLPAGIVADANISRKGVETRAGTTVLAHGTRLSPVAVAVAASVGKARVMVHPMPSCAIIATGNEILGDGATAGHIRDSNSPMLAAAARAIGIQNVRRRQVGDTAEAILAALAEVDGADLIVLTGGVSVGIHDAVPAALAKWGATMVFHKVEQKPGKPMLFAVKNRRLIFALPGNPMAAHLCFHRYVAAAARKLAGQPTAPRRVTATLVEPAIGDSQRAYFIAVKVIGSPTGLRALPLPSHGSGDVFSAATANALLRLAPGQRMEPGSSVMVEWLQGSDESVLVNRSCDVPSARDERS